MRLIKIILLFLTAFVISLHGITAQAAIHIIAAENVYGDIAQQIGGRYVSISSVLNSPSQDPHLFSMKPSIAKQAAEADIIIYNGADYDPWVKSLLAIQGQKRRSVINVAQLMGIRSGSNPHLWYLPETMPRFAEQLTSQLQQLNPAHQDYFGSRLKQFKQNYQIILDKIATLKNRFQHTPVIATESIFNYMADSIGLVMHGKAFQISIMNDVPPSISQIKQFESDLRQHTVRVLIYNKQVMNPMTNRMIAIASEEKIPVVGVSEMIPPDTTFVEWMINQLNELEKALANKHEPHS